MKNYQEIFRLTSGNFLRFLFKLLAENREHSEEFYSEGSFLVIENDQIEKYILILLKIKKFPRNSFKNDIVLGSTFSLFKMSKKNGISALSSSYFTVAIPTHSTHTADHSVRNHQNVASIHHIVHMTVHAIIYGIHCGAQPTLGIIQTATPD